MSLSVSFVYLDSLMTEKMALTRSGGGQFCSKNNDQNQCVKNHISGTRSFVYCDCLETIQNALPVWLSMALCVSKE